MSLHNLWSRIENRYWSNFKVSMSICVHEQRLRYLITQMNRVKLEKNNIFENLKNFIVLLIRLI